MSKIQVVCSIVLIAFLVFFNIFGWLHFILSDRTEYDYSENDNILRCLLIMSDFMIFFGVLAGVLGMFG